MLDASYSKSPTFTVSVGEETSATLMSTVSASEGEPSSSVTTRLNVRVSPPDPTSGAVNDGEAEVSSDNVTVVPTV